MLEQDLIDLFERQASEDQTPARASIAAAARDGRALRRRRRASVIGAPAFAAAGILAIALASSVLTGTGRQAPGRAPSPVSAAPARFPSPLRPYVRIGWLPPGERLGQFDLDSTEVLIDWGNPFGQLEAFAAGQCTLAGPMLTCPVDNLPAKYGRHRLGRQIGLVHGRPAYWNPTGGELISEEITVSQNGVTKSTNAEQDGDLWWQYAPGGWVEVQALSGPAALKIARTARFGPAVAPPFTFPVQLTDVPASWHIDSTTITRTSSGRLSSASLNLAGEEPGLIVGPGSRSNCVTPFGPGDTTRLRSQMINGYRVDAFIEKSPRPPSWALCTSDAAGVDVAIVAGTSRAEVSEIFAHHLRLLGPGPANWTTRPIG
jgi:hypothetical protein